MSTYVATVGPFVVCFSPSTERIEVGTGDPASWKGLSKVEAKALRKALKVASKRLERGSFPGTE